MKHSTDRRAAFAASWTAGPARFVQWSNALTWVSLFCGMAAIFAARPSGNGYGNWEAAAALLAAAALADTFDGRFARRFRRTAVEEKFGAQLDSLVDAVSFGVAPVICLDSLTAPASPAARAILLAAGFLYALAAVTRLGDYNTREQSGAGAFTGLPTTLAALIWATVFLAHPPAIIASCILVALGLAMISPFRIPRAQGFAMTCYMLWFVFVWIAAIARMVLLFAP